METSIELKEMGCTIKDPKLVVAVEKGNKGNLEVLAVAGISSVRRRLVTSASIVANVCKES